MNTNTFETTRPIAVKVEIGAGSVQLIAGDRADTSVVVGPSDPARRADVEAADGVRVDFSEDRLDVKAAKPGGIGALVGIGKTGSVEVTIELPEKSAIDVSTGAGEVRADGRFGDVQVQNGAGAIHIDQASGVQLATGAGSASITRSHGDAEVTAGGDVRIGRVDGSAGVKNVNGETWIGEVRGRLRVRSANGSVHVDRALTDFAARTSNGNIDAGEVLSGSVSLASGYGHIAVGIGQGTAAWVDAKTKFGRIDNTLEGVEGPTAPGDQVEVRARTSFGDISIHRSSVEENRTGEK